jgi:hypothetical protein
MSWRSVVVRGCLRFTVEPCSRLQPLSVQETSVLEQMARTWGKWVSSWLQIPER